MSRTRVSGVVLAAGPSRRFGEDPPKQLALYKGEPLVHRVVHQAVGSHLSEVIVVVGMAAAKVEESLQGFQVRIIRNPGFGEGQSTSVRAGLAAVDERATAAMFIPADQPRLSSPVINDLIDLYLETRASIVVPTHEGRRGAPVLIDRTLFGELAAIEGDVGGRQIFARHEESVAELALATGEPLYDVDSPDDLQRLDP